MTTVRVDRLHLVTDRPLGEREARALGDSFAGALGTELGRDVRIGELVLELPGHALQDRQTMREAVQRVARQILGREAV